MTVISSGGSNGRSLSQPVRLWVARNPHWASQLSNVEGQLRRSTVEEVATFLVQDPEFLAALTAVTSPFGQAVEQAALSTWMSPEDAKLLSAALTRALKTVRNQNLPVWKRADVLIGVAAVIVIGAGVLGAVRHRQQKAQKGATVKHRRKQSHR